MIRKKLAKRGILVSRPWCEYRERRKTGLSSLQSGFRIFFRTIQTSRVNDGIQICSCVNVICEN